MSVVDRRTSPTFPSLSSPSGLLDGSSSLRRSLWQFGIGSPVSRCPTTAQAGGDQAARETGQTHLTKPRWRTKRVLGPPSGPMVLSGYEIESLSFFMFSEMAVLSCRAIVAVTSEQASGCGQ